MLTGRNTFLYSKKNYSKKIEMNIYWWNITKKLFACTYNLQSLIQIIKYNKIQHSWNKGNFQRAHSLWVLYVNIFQKSADWIFKDQVFSAGITKSISKWPTIVKAISPNTLRELFLLLILSSVTDANQSLAIHFDYNILPKFKTLVSYVFN